MTQDGDPPAKKEDESLPEVEAELVNETPPLEDAFEDDAPQDPPPADVDENPSGNSGGEKRKPTLTPGVILFIVFAVVALIAFGVWRFQLRPGDDAATGDATPTVEKPAAIDVQPQTAPSDDAAAAGAEDDAPETTAKIDNLPEDDLAPSSPPEESSGFLPPVTEEGAAKIANSVEDGAKEAMRQFGEAEDASEDSLSAEEETAPEEAGETEAPATEDEAAQAPAEAETSIAVEASPPVEDAAVALQSEMEAMREAFEEERAHLSAELETANARLETQDREIAGLRAELENRDGAATAEITALRAELQKIRNDRAKASARQMKASFALAALSRAVDQGGPYAEELAAIEEFEPGASAALEAHAETGVATDAALRERFNAAARKALAAAGQEEAGGGLSGLLARAKSLVSVRPARPMDGDDPGAVLSRADNALEQGEVAFALLQLEDLPLAAQEAMADWIAAARARAEAEAAVAALTVRIAGDSE